LLAKKFETFLWGLLFIYLGTIWIFYGTVSNVRAKHRRLRCSVFTMNQNCFIISLCS
jgi:hypothetical protein